MALTVILISSCTQDNIKGYVLGNTTNIKNISPDSNDYSDLRAIGDAIGDSRLVMLGEQDHGDAPTFLAKTRLVKYLHEKKGFKVLAFESDFFALNKGWDLLDKHKAKTDSFLLNNVFSVWTECGECGNLLYNYIPKTYEDKQPLIVTGFDSQIHGLYSLKNLKIFIDKYLKRKNIGYVNSERYETDFLSFIDSIKYNKNTQKQINFKNALKQIISELPSKESGTFEIILMKSLMANAESEISFLSKENNFLDIRDKQMAENLKWLLKYKFSNEKIIVWAHNVHILKRPDLITGSFLIKNNMGSYISKDQQLNSQSYVLGFNSKFGTSGRITIDKKIAVDTPANNSFESWIPKNVPYAFVDFKQFRNENTSRKKYFLMKGVYHSTDSASWTDVYDGVFYIRDMYPCSP